MVRSVNITAFVEYIKLQKNIKLLKIKAKQISNSTLCKLHKKLYSVMWCHTMEAWFCHRKSNQNNKIVFITIIIIIVVFYHVTEMSFHIRSYKNLQTKVFDQRYTILWLLV